MILLRTSDRREATHDLWLGGTTAITAGIVNVCSVMAFFAFSSNVTGHVAIFAEEVVKGHWHQVSVVVGWILMFLLGAFVANLLVTTLGPRNIHVAHAAPIVLQMLGLMGVGYYGHQHYLETLTETEYLVGTLLFTMGLQNGTVSTVSKLVVRTTHLTGLFTDLGMELSMILQRRYRHDNVLRFKLALHVIILVSYVLGGMLGGVLYMHHGFQAFYLSSMVLGAILLYDLSMLRRVEGWSFSQARPSEAPHPER